MPTVHTYLLHREQRYIHTYLTNSFSLTLSPPLRTTLLPFVSFRSDLFRSVPSSAVPSRPVPFRPVPFHSVPFHSVSSRFILAFIFCFSFFYFFSYVLLRRSIRLATSKIRHGSHYQTHLTFEKATPLGVACQPSERVDCFRAK